MMDRKISTHYHTELVETIIGTIFLKGNLTKLTKIKCAYHSTSSKDGVIGTRPALPVKQAEIVQNTWNKCFQTLDRRQHKTVILEEKETKEVIRMNIWARSLEALSWSSCRRTMVILWVKGEIRVWEAEVAATCEPEQWEGGRHAEKEPQESDCGPSEPLAEYKAACEKWPSTEANTGLGMHSAERHSNVDEREGGDLSRPCRAIEGLNSPRIWGLLTLPTEYERMTGRITLICSNSSACLSKINVL